MNHLLLARLIATLLAAMTAAAAGAAEQPVPAATTDKATTEPVTVAQLAATQCAGCHGVDGNSVKPSTVPKLAGQHADYLYKQLRNFKAADGKPPGPANPMYPTPSDLVYVAAPEGKLPERTNPIFFLAMNGMVHGLGDDDMKRLAVYFSGLRRMPAVSTKSTDALAAAQKLYRAGDPARGLASCAGCHGPTGAGLPAQFPRLSGQFAVYTEAQLRNFRSGDRANDPNRMMRDVAYKLTEDEISLLSDYIAGLR